MSLNRFESLLRPDGRLGAVYERDDETAYFYLCRTHAEEPEILQAFSVWPWIDHSGRLAETVRWSPDGELAGLFVGQDLIAVLNIAPSQSLETCAGRQSQTNDLPRFARAN